jgi:hypothetical protein
MTNARRYGELLNTFGGRLTAKGTGEMADDKFSETVSQLTNALQVVAVLATKLRREISTSADDTVTLEQAAERAVKSVRRLAER